LDFSLFQFNGYIAAIEAVQNNPELNTLSHEFPAYPAPLKTVMQEEQSNLYSMHLRPTIQDVNLRSINPVFSLNRKNNDSGNPDSVFYQTLHNTYKTLTLVPQDARARLVTATLTSAEVQNNNFEGMQQVLRQKTKEQLGVDFDFTQTHTGQPVDKNFINASMMFDSTTTPAEYIEDKLPRVLTYYNFNSGSDVPLFPLVVSGSSGLGVDFALIRNNLISRAKELCEEGKSIIAIVDILNQEGFRPTRQDTIFTKVMVRSLLTGAGVKSHKQTRSQQLIRLPDEWTIQELSHV